MEARSLLEKFPLHLDGRLHLLGICCTFKLHRQVLVLAATCHLLLLAVRHSLSHSLLARLLDRGEELAFACAELLEYVALLRQLLLLEAELDVRAGLKVGHVLLLDLLGRLEGARVVEAGRAGFNFVRS